MLAERGAPGDKLSGGVLRQRDAPLVDNALVFLFEFEKHLAARLGHAVAAQPQLFLVCRLFERGTDEPVVGRIIIYIADGALAMLVRGHSRAERGFKRGALCVCNAVFELPPFKRKSAHDIGLLCFDEATIRRFPEICLKKKSAPKKNLRGG